MKKVFMILAFVLIGSLTACKSGEEFPLSAADFGEGEKDTAETVMSQERKELAELRENLTVREVRIEIDPLDVEMNEYQSSVDRLDMREFQYSVNLDEATATVRFYNWETETYLLDSEQVDRLRRLLSEYALTVYDGRPYWPTGDYCTMRELFRFSVFYNSGSGGYQESGALGYPEGWKEFIQNLRELILSGEKVSENGE